MAPALTLPDAPGSSFGPAPSVQPPAAGFTGGAFKADSRERPLTTAPGIHNLPSRQDASRQQHQQQQIPSGGPSSSHQQQHKGQQQQSTSVAAASSTQQPYDPGRHRQPRHQHAARCSPQTVLLFQQEGVNMEGGIATMMAPYFCHLCGIATTSEANLADHCQGRKHQQRLRRQAEQQHTPPRPASASQPPHSLAAADDCSPSTPEVYVPAAALRPHGAALDADGDPAGPEPSSSPPAEALAGVVGPIRRMPSGNVYDNFPCVRVGDFNLPSSMDLRHYLEEVQEVGSLSPMFDATVLAATFDELEAQAAAASSPALPQGPAEREGAGFDDAVHSSPHSPGLASDIAQETPSPPPEPGQADAKEAQGDDPNSASEPLHLSVATAEPPSNPDPHPDGAATASTGTAPSLNGQQSTTAPLSDGRKYAATPETADGEQHGDGETSEAATEGEFLCELCGVSTTSEAHLKAHLAGRRHQRKVEAAERGGIAPPPPFCELCGVSTTSAQHMELHIAGRAHRRKQLLATLHSRQEQLVSSSSGLSSVPSLSDATSQSSVAAPPHEAGAAAGTCGGLPAGAGLVYVCSLCNITATSHENLQAHFRGAQHNKRVRKRAQEQVMPVPHSSAAHPELPHQPSPPAHPAQGLVLYQGQARADFGQRQQQGYHGSARSAAHASQQPHYVPLQQPQVAVAAGAAPVALHPYMALPMQSYYQAQMQAAAYYPAPATTYPPGVPAWSPPPTTFAPPSPPLYTYHLLPSPPLSPSRYYVPHRY